MLLSALRIALRSLLAHRLRSALTMLGIVIGVASVVVMVSVGTGARERVIAQIRSFGANLISINPGSARMTSVRLGAGASPRLDEHDARAIASQIQGVSVVAPVLYAKAQITAGSANWAGNIRGVTPHYLTAREWGVSTGRELTGEDDVRSAKVILVGETIREKLFGETDPVGALVRVRDVPFTVVGVLGRKGQTVWGDDQDDVALVPLTTARRHFVGTSRASPRLVHNVTVKFRDDGSADEVMSAIRELLGQRHRLRPGQDESFRVSNLAEAAEAEQSAANSLSLLLAAIASVSLIVGGIGIMNIMLVTVAERTREIGLRLAVGARQKHIRVQFLVEAAVIAALGGLIGAMLGTAVAAAIGLFAEWPIVLELRWIALSVGLAAAVGLFFGVYPARVASRLQPIEALRME
jgi:putative ABC transport system permease protein